MTPFILKGRKEIRSEPKATADQRYDRSQQIWINRRTGQPVVVEMQRRRSAVSHFGETTLTATVEGADQSEIASQTVSQFAEHKLYQLQIAKSEGLRVPRTLISRDVAALQGFCSNNANGTICKPIFHGLFIENSSKYSIYTRRISSDELNKESIGA